MVIGWDIGGVNTKVARVSGGNVMTVRTRAFELQLAPAALSGLLRELAGEVGMHTDDTHAVTMTAELSQMFRTKRDGVAFVLDAVEAAFPDARLRIFTVGGDFVDARTARANPMDVAAANWAATGHIVAKAHADAILIDVGTTTTDVIPISSGRVVAAGRTDPERLASGELVYTGALRTTVEAIVSHVPYRGAPARVSAEAFALAGDVHVWRGDLSPKDYCVPAPDRRPVSREFAGERLARVVCADRELIDEGGITAIADAVASAQIGHITDAIRQVRARHPKLRTAVVTGLGAFLGRSAAHAAGLDVVPLAAELGDDGARCAPAVCVALLAEHESGIGDPGSGIGGAHGTTPFQSTASGLTVVKIGGGVLVNPEHLDSALRMAADVARERPILIVPGGGPFADAVRDVDRRVGLSDDAAHWMAILAMDQYAHLIAGRLERAVVVTTLAEARDVLSVSRIPVLAPSRWLQDADPLPHSWDVTSDSIAAWVAGQAGAERLLLIKPPGARGPAVVDRHFATACPSGLSVVVAPVDALEEHLSRG